MKRVSRRVGYRLTAAGVLGCLLISGTMGPAMDRKRETASVNSIPITPVLQAAMPMALPLSEGALLSADTAYVAVKNQPRITPPEIATEEMHGITYTIQSGDTLEAIAAAYDISLERITTRNGITTEDILQIDQTLFLPGARPEPTRNLLASRGEVRRAPTPPPAAQVEPPKVKVTVPAAPASGNTWVWPLTRVDLFSEFAAPDRPWHSGLDMAAPLGTKVGAARTGTVTVAGWDDGYGHFVILDHGGGIKTRYAHASSILVEVGQSVEAGSPVILVGSSGNSTGPHLHFEVIVNGETVNPRNYLPER